MDLRRFVQQPSGKSSGKPIAAKDCIHFSQGDFASTRFHAQLFQWKTEQYDHN